MSTPILIHGSAERGQFRGFLPSAARTYDGIAESDEWPRQSSSEPQSPPPPTHRTLDSIFVMVFSGRRWKAAHSQTALPEHAALLRDMENVARDLGLQVQTQRESHINGHHYILQFSIMRRFPPPGQQPTLTWLC